MRCTKLEQVMFMSYHDTCDLEAFQEESKSAKSPCKFARFLRPLENDQDDHLSSLPRLFLGVFLGPRSAILRP